MVKNQNAPNFKKVKLVTEQFNFKDKNAVLVQHNYNVQNVGHVDKTSTEAIWCRLQYLKANLQTLLVLALTQSSRPSSQTTPFVPPGSMEGVVWLCN